MVPSFGVVYSSDFVYDFMFDLHSNRRCDLVYVSAIWCPTRITFNLFFYQIEDAISCAISCPL
jgi:hypothetical protein